MSVCLTVTESRTIGGQQSDRSIAVGQIAKSFEQTGLAIRFRFIIRPMLMLALLLLVVVQVVVSSFAVLFMRRTPRPNRLLSLIRLSMDMLLLLMMMVMMQAHRLRFVHIFVRFFQLHIVCF